MLSSGPASCLKRARLSAFLWILGIPLFPAFALFVADWHLDSPPAADMKTREVSAPELARWHSPLLLDTRSRIEEQIPGALPLNEDEWYGCLPAVLDAWEPGRKVVVICSGRSYRQGHAVALRLRKETGWGQIFVFRVAANAGAKNE